MFILVAGEVFVTRDEVQNTVIAKLRPGGDVFGEISFITRKLRATNVIAGAKSIVLKLKSEIWKVLGSDITWKFYTQLLKVHINRISGLNDTIIKLKEDLDGCPGSDPHLGDEISSVLKLESELREKLQGIQKTMNMVVR